MPVGEAPHKHVEQDAGRDARYELCRLAASKEEWLSVSRDELDRDGPSYTVDTLRALHESVAGDELFFIMGGDEARALPDWKEPEDVLRLATVAVAERELARKEEVSAAIAGLAGSERVTFFSMPAVEVSSTMVRERVAAGRPIRYLVPEEVADYIREAGLYRPGVTA